MTVPSKILIEVGAFDGKDSLRYHRNGYRVFTFEPNRVLYDALCAKTRDLEHYTVIPKAVAATNGTTTFHICREGGASSILPFRSDEELRRTWTARRTDIQYSGVSYDVATTRLDTFLEEQGLTSTRIDYLHVDAQGVDLDVLRSLGGYISLVQAGVVETVMDPAKSIYVNQTSNTLANVQAFLHDHGFEVTRVESNDVTQCEFNVHFRRV
jgi:FkbM family methyltransferase